MGAVLKLAPDLEAADVAFAENTQRLASVVDRIEDQEIKQIMSDTVDSMINLAQGLKIALGTPKYHNTYGPTIKREQHNEIGSVQEFVNAKFESHQHSTHQHEINVEAQPADWIYWLSPNLIISTNGHFVFRPQDRKLLTAVGAIELSELEVQELFRVLKKDYRIRGAL